MAETPIINGSLAAFLTARRRSFDPSRGLIYTEEYRSAGDNLGALADLAISGGLTVEHEPNGRISRLSISSGNDPNLGTSVESDTWQIVGNEIALPIGQHPNVLAFPASGSGSYRDVLEKVNFAKSGTQFENASIAPPTFTQNATAAMQLFNLMVAGTDSFNIGQYVLRHTTNVSNRYAANIADFNVESVYSTSALVSEISDTGLWTYPCPPRLIYKLQNISPQFTTDADVYWGWRKLPSTETTAANNRIDINTEYILFGWSRLLYPIVA